MANTYTQLHIHFVFAVKFRGALIHPSFKDELYQYITGIVKSYNHKLLCINGMPDHIHILIGFRPTQSIADLMKLVKNNSSKWINEKKFLKVQFEWQEGYGAFSYSKTDLKNIINYIQNQEKHHAKVTFKQEFILLLEEYELEYDINYLFNEPI